MRTYIIYGASSEMDQAIPSEIEKGIEYARLLLLEEYNAYWLSSGHTVYLKTKTRRGHDNAAARAAIRMLTRMGVTTGGRPAENALEKSLLDDLVERGDLVRSGYSLVHKDDAENARSNPRVR